MRKTKKYVAAKAVMLERGASAPYEHVELYALLETQGYYWSAADGEWKSGLQPSTSVFKSDEGEATGTVKIRVMAHPDDVDTAVRLLMDSKLKVLSVSDRYENRRGAGVRVYVEAKI